MWWENTIFYEIYVPSWPSLTAISEHLDFLRELGLTGIWLTPFYPSPLVDNGYDISDYCAVDPKYGSLEEFKKLVLKAHQLGIKVIIDQVYNHTSTDHPWFKEHPDWYVWRKSSNNWESFFGGSAWEYDSSSGQYYYHSFAKEQADLNWANPEVKTAIFSVIDFWKGLGVDGFRLDVINNLTLSHDFPDNPLGVDGKQVHQFDVNQAGIKEIIGQLKQHMGDDCFTVGEISSDKLEILTQYSDVLDCIFNFNFGSIESFDLEKIYQELEQMQGLKLPTLFFNSHDMSRSWNRLAQEDIDSYCQLATLILLGNGLPFLYQGEEIAMGNFLAHSPEEIKDVQALNKYRETGSLEAANQVNRDKSRQSIDWTADLSEVSKEALAFYKKLIKIHRNSKMTSLSIKNGLLSYQLADLRIYLNFSQENCEIEGIPLVTRHYSDKKLQAKGIYIGS